MAAAVLGLADVLAFLRLVHGQLATAWPVFRTQHKVVAALPHLQGSDGGFEVVQQFREVLPHKGNAYGAPAGVFERAVVRHVLAPKQ